jgi:hypothetical protein
MYEEHSLVFHFVYPKIASAGIYLETNILIVSFKPNGTTARKRGQERWRVLGNREYRLVESKLTRLLMWTDIVNGGVYEMRSATGS